MLHAMTLDGATHHAIRKLKRRNFERIAVIKRCYRCCHRSDVCIKSRRVEIEGFPVLEVFEKGGELFYRVLHGRGRLRNKHVVEGMNLLADSLEKRKVKHRARI